MDELHKSLNAEVSKLIKIEAEAAMDDAAVEEELKAAEELVGSQEIAQQLHQQELGLQNEAFRIAKRSR